MPFVELSADLKARVDREDFARVSAFKWSTASKRYARRSVNGRHVYLHRFIVSAPKGLDVDHINGDTLDNRRSNLRVCTRRQNLQNMQCKSKSSPYKGVSLDKRINRWRALIRVNGRRMYLGSFATDVEAGRAYKRAAKLHFGEFANAR